MNLIKLLIIILIQYQKSKTAYQNYMNIIFDISKRTLQESTMKHLFSHVLPKRSIIWPAFNASELLLQIVSYFIGTFSDFDY